jgi:protein-arginine kinase activator protein McsA
LEKEMAKAIETQNFERAAAIRDEIKSLKGEN